MKDIVKVKEKDNIKWYATEIVSLVYSCKEYEPVLSLG
jgi:hypothetical protein